MIDWYSSYLLSRERQRELIRQAEQRRQLEKARGTSGARRSDGRPARSPIRRRTGELLRPLERAHPS